MRKLICLSILILTFIATGCQDPTTPEAKTKTVEVPGQLSVRFVNNVDVTEAYELMDELALTAIDFSNLQLKEEPNWGTVGVPEGKEVYWSYKITHYPIVRSAYLKTKEVPVQN